MKILWSARDFDLIHLAFTYAMSWVGRSRVLTWHERRAEISRLRTLCSKVWREGWTEETMTLCFVVLGFVPVTSQVARRSERLRSRLREVGQF